MFASFERKKILSIYFVNLLDVFMKSHNVITIKRYLNFTSVVIDDGDFKIVLHLGIVVQISS